ncbi:MAG: hypothetical protein ACP5HG_17680 [Anaerolineae bacterium]
MKGRKSVFPFCWPLWAAVIMVVLRAVAWPQGVIEPLRRPEEDLGAFTWKMGIGYAPFGEAGLTADEYGRPCAWTRLTQEWRLTLAGSVVFGSGLKAGIEFVDAARFVDETRTYPSGEVRASYVQEKLAYSSALEWRVAPDSPWDPRVTLSLGDPWRSAVDLSVSLLRDPVVLAGEIGVCSRQEKPRDWVRVTMGAGFTANSLVKVIGAASIVVPTSGVAFPAGSVGLGVRYALDAVGRRELALHVTLGTEGGRAWLAVDVWATGRGGGLAP